MLTPSVQRSQQRERHLPSVNAIALGYIDIFVPIIYREILLLQHGIFFFGNFYYKSIQLKILNAEIKKIKKKSGISGIECGILLNIYIIKQRMNKK